MFMNVVVIVNVTYRQTCNKSTNSQVQVHYRQVRVQVRVRLK